MIEALAKFVSRHWLFTILAWIVLISGVKTFAPNWDDVTHDGDLAYLPERMTTARSDRLLTAAFPDYKTRSQLVIVFERDEKLSEDDLNFAADLGDRIRKEAGLPIEGEDEEAAADPEEGRTAATEGAAAAIVDVWSYFSEVVGEKLLSEDEKSTLVVLSIKNEFMATTNIDLVKYVEKILEDERKAGNMPAGMKWGLSGSAAVGGDMLMAAIESIDKTEMITVVLVLIILLLVYRAPLLVFVPLITIIVSVVVSMGLVAALTQLQTLPGWEWFNFKVFKTTRIFIITLLFGCGTDFCLFLISRYQEELELGRDKAEAVRHALSQVGHAIIASAFTVICGLSMMFFADFGKFRNSGPSIGLCLLVTLIACITLAPAMLRMLGGAVFWPFGAPKPKPAGDKAEKPSFSSIVWTRISYGIMRRPGLILITSIVVMSVPAWYGTKTVISYDLVNELGEERPSRIGTDMLRDHFPAGDTGPVTVFAKLPGKNFDDQEARYEIRDLTSALYEVDPSLVKAVRSLEEPLGEKPTKSRLSAREIMRKSGERKHARTKATYLSSGGALPGAVTRFDIVLDSDPFSSQSQAFVNKLDKHLTALSKDTDSPWYGAEFDLSGTTAGTRDLKAVTDSDQILIQQLVIVAVLAVIMILLRKPIVCIYLIASVVFSYYATLGVTYWLFGTLYPTSEGLDWKVPIFLFVILVAVGEDYNIYLVTRVVEEQKKWGLREGVRVAVEKTGGIITSCGIIMAGSFVSMTFTTLRGMIELGFALTLGIILDTFFVRPVLVPAFLFLLYRWKGAPEIEPHETRESEPANRPVERSAPHTPVGGSVGAGRR